MNRTSRPRNSRQICQAAVTAVLESRTIEFHVQYDTVVAMMNDAADDGNADFGQLRTFLTPLGETTDAYRGAIGTYMRVMARTGNHLRSLEAAAEYANLESPAGDRGPFDRAAAAFQSKFDQPGSTGVTARVGGFLRRHSQPRRSTSEHN